MGPMTCLCLASVPSCLFVSLFVCLSPVACRLSPVCVWLKDQNGRHFVTACVLHRPGPTHLPSPTSRWNGSAVDNGVRVRLWLETEWSRPEAPAEGTPNNATSLPMRAFCFCHWAVPNNLCARQSDPIQPFQILCACFRSTHAPCPMPPHGPWPPCQPASLPAYQACLTGEATRRHRHDPSAVEVRNLGSACSRPPGRPLQSTQQPQLALRRQLPAIPSSHTEGRRALCHLATCPPPSSLSRYGRHCRSTSNEASTPSPGHLWCGCCESVSPRLNRNPKAQAHVALDGMRLHFAEIQISQNPTGWAPQRSLAPRTCRAPSPSPSPSQSPSYGALVVLNVA